MIDHHTPERAGRHSGRRSARWITALAALVASGLAWGAPAAADPAPVAPAVPVESSDANPDDGVSMIHAFGEHTCGVQDDRLYCWGHASDSRLGTYDFRDAFKRRTSPRFGLGVSEGSPESDYMLDEGSDGFDNTGDKGIVGMGGLYTSCVIQGATPSADSGTVYCWGPNTVGEAGIGSTSNSVSVPRRVVNGSEGFTNTNVLMVDGGPGHTCAVEGASPTATDGVVYCWGDASSRQLGQGSSTIDSLTPVEVDGDSDFTNSGITDLSVGFNHSCVITGGTVYCWGANGDAVGAQGGATQIFPASLNSGASPFPFLITTGGAGRAGSPASDALIGIPAAVQTGGGFTNAGNVEQVSAGYRHSCAIESGAVYCWGNNSSGQLGNGTTDASDTPVKVVSGGGFTNTAVTKVVAGDHHTCAVESGVVYCWGEAQLGRLGDQATIRAAADSTPVSAPVKVADGAMTNSGVNLADGSGAHMCATKDSMAYCWGPGEKWSTLSDGTMTIQNYFSDGFPRMSNAPSPRLVRWFPPAYRDPFAAPQPPSEPLNVTAESSRRAVTVRWDAPADDGGGSITNYLVQATPSRKVCITRNYNEPALSAPDGGRNCTFTSLTAGTDYTFKVYALNYAGWSPLSEASNETSPLDIKIRSYQRKRPFLSAIVGTDLRVGGIAPGYPAGTRVTPMIAVGSGGFWSGNSTTVKADGTFSWQRRFGRNDTGKSIRVSFVIGSEVSNQIRVDPASGRRSRSGERVTSLDTDLGGMPATSVPTTDIQFGFENDTQIGGDLPVQFHGTGLEPGSTVTAELTRTAPTGFTAIDLWHEDYTDASNVVDDYGDVFTIVSLPDDLAAGFYSVTFTGTAPDGSTVSETNDFAVTDNASSWIYSQGENLEPVRRIYSNVDPTPKPAAPDAAGVTIVTPARLVDTRKGEGLAAGEVLEVAVLGQGGVPRDATAVMLNVTATEHVGDDGFLTVYPCGASRPDTSNLNVNDEGTVANAVTVGLDSTGKVCVYSYKATEVVVDVMGYSAPDSAMLLNPVPLSRVLDTRKWDAPKPAADDVVEVTIPNATGVGAVALNVTMVDADDDNGFITVYPCGVARPDTSNANAPERGTAAGSVLVPVGTGGKVCVYTSVGADILVDISGHYRTDYGLGVQVHDAARLVDTRKVATLRTVEDEEWGTLEEADEESFGLRMAAGETQQVFVDAGYAGTAAAIIANITVENPAEAGFLTVYDCADSRPDTSNLNYAPRENRANQVVIPVTSETLCVYTFSEVSLIVDVVGRYVDN